MILGLGIDIIEPDRIETSLEKFGDEFLTKIFTTDEIDYCKSKRNAHLHFAARFAAKEALLKAFGTGMRNSLSWKEIEIRNNDLGAPYIMLYGEAKALSGNKGVSKIHLSLTHDKSYSAATVILESE